MRVARQFVLLGAVAVLTVLATGGTLTTGLEAQRGSILVDASRDGGVWWSPQSEGFDPDAPHQGSALVASLGEAGYQATELGPGTPIDLVTLLRYPIVIRAGEAAPYTPNEREAYRRYVERGGSLLLLSEYRRPYEVDTLALEFGVEFAGVTVGEPVAAPVQPTPLTVGVADFFYGVGSGAVRLPPGAVVDAEFVGPGYLDLDGDGVAGALEPTRPVVVGHFEFGHGRIVFAGDVNMWQAVPQPLLANTLSWLTHPSPPQPPDLVLFQPLITGPVAHVNGVTVPGSPGVAVVRITWDWGDGTVEDAWFPSVHTYDQPGDYALRVTSHQDDGLSTTSAIAVHVEASGARLLLPGVARGP